MLPLYYIVSISTDAPQTLVLWSVSFLLYVTLAFVTQSYKCVVSKYMEHSLNYVLHFDK